MYKFSVDDAAIVNTMHDSHQETTKPVASTESGESNPAFGSMVIERQRKRRRRTRSEVEDLAMKIDGDEMADVLEH